MTNIFGGPYWRRSPAPPPPSELPPAQRPVDWQRRAAEGLASGLIELAEDIRSRAYRTLRTVEIAAGVFMVCVMLVTAVALVMAS